MPEPRKGDNVWIQGRQQPNGKIIYILYEDEEACVRYYDTGVEELIPLGLFDYFNERANQWQLQGL